MRSNHKIDPQFNLSAVRNENDLDFEVPPVPDFQTTTDDWYLKFKQHLEDYPENYPKFELENGNIFKIEFDKVTNRTVLKLVVPTDFRDVLMQQYHCSISSAHMGAEKTLARLKSRYYWAKYKVVCFKM